MGKTFAEIRLEVEKALNEGELSHEQYQEIKDSINKQELPKIILSNGTDTPQRFVSAAPEGDDIWNDLSTDSNGSISIENNAKLDVNIPTLQDGDMPLVAAMYCIDCFSMTQEKKYASFIGFGFSLFDEHAIRFLENQKKQHH